MWRWNAATLAALSRIASAMWSGWFLLLSAYTASSPDPMTRPATDVIPAASPATIQPRDRDAELASSGSSMVVGLPDMCVVMVFPFRKPC